MLGAMFALPLMAWVLLGVGPADRAEAAPGDPSVTFTPASAAPGSIVRVSGDLGHCATDPTGPMKLPITRIVWPTTDVTSDEPDRILPPLTTTPEPGTTTFRSWFRVPAKVSPGTRTPALECRIGSEETLPLTAGLTVLPVEGLPAPAVIAPDDPCPPDVAAAAPRAADRSLRPTTSAVAQSVPRPSDLTLTSEHVAYAAGGTVAMVALVAFPAALLDRTLEVNRHLMPWWMGGGVRRRPVATGGGDTPPPRPLHPPTIGATGTPPAPPPPPPRLSWARIAWATAAPALGLLTFSAVAAVLLALIEPKAGWNGRTAAFALGLFLALPLVTWAATRPGERYLRRLTGLRGRLRLVPAAIVLAASMAAFSRYAHFVPGFVFGLVIGYVAPVDRWSRVAPGERHVHEGRAALRGALWLLGLALVGWLGLAALHRAGDDGALWHVVLREMCTAVFVLGVEAVAIGLLPLPFLEGSRVLRWSRVRWALVFVPTVALFSYVLLTHYRTDVERDRVDDVLRDTVSLCAVFAMVTILLWVFFRWYAGRVARAGGTSGAR